MALPSPPAVPAMRRPSARIASTSAPPTACPPLVTVTVTAGDCGRTVIAALSLLVALPAVTCSVAVWAPCAANVWLTTAPSACAPSPKVQW